MEAEPKLDALPLEGIIDWVAVEKIELVRVVVNVIVLLSSPPLLASIEIRVAIVTMLVAFPDIVMVEYSTELGLGVAVSVSSVVELSGVPAVSVTWIGGCVDEELDSEYEVPSVNDVVALADDDNSSGVLPLAVDDEVSGADDAVSAETPEGRELVALVSHSELDTTPVPEASAVELLPNGKGGAELEADREPAKLSPVVRTGIDTELVSVGKSIVIVGHFIVLDVLEKATVDSLAMLDEVAFSMDATGVEVVLVKFHPIAEEEDDHGQPDTAVPDDK